MKRFILFYFSVKSEKKSASPILLLLICSTHTHTFSSDIFLKFFINFIMHHIKKMSYVFQRSTQYFMLDEY